MHKKIDQIDNDDDIQDWDNFIKEVHIAFSNKSKAADAK